MTALITLRNQIRAGARPDELWAYMTTTGREKRANYHADRAEQESATRRRLNGREEPSNA